MAGGIVYHWRHGWIPLTHAAALSKAHGNSHLADKYVPSAHEHHGGSSIATRGKSAHAIHGTLEAHRDAHGPDAGIRNRGDLAGAIKGLPSVPDEHKREARHQVRTAADKLGVKSLPGPTAPKNLRALSDDELTQHLASADTAELTRIVDELDRRDGLEKRRQQAEHRRAERTARQDAEFDRRVEAGDDAEQAYADVYGVNVEKQRRQSAITALRDQGYKGAGFHELSAAAYRDHVNEQMLAAEHGTNGALFKGTTRAEETRNTRRLFTDERYARAHASEELRAWLDNHGSFTTLADYRASILGGHRAAGRQSWY